MAKDPREQQRTDAERIPDDRPDRLDIEDDDLDLDDEDPDEDDVDDDEDLEEV